MFVLNYFFVTHLEAVLDVEISWKFEASTMKNRGENEKWKIVEKKKKKKKKETLRKQKGLPMKSEDLNDLKTQKNTQRCHSQRMHDCCEFLL